jgi:hypothetical protein
MKTQVALVLAIATVCVYAANVVYLPTPLTNGVPYILARASNTDKTICSYYTLAVPNNTAAVNIEVTNSKSAPSYLSVTAGFNYFPRADQDTSASGNGFLFSSNEINVGAYGRYTLCNYNPVSTTNLENMPSTGSVNAAACTAFVPDLNKGGDVVVCLSAFSTSSAVYSGITITMTSVQPQSDVVRVDGTQTLNIPAATNTNTGVVRAYTLVVPSTTVKIEISTDGSSSETVVIVPGLGTNPTRSFGSYNMYSTMYTAIIFSKATAVRVATITGTANSCPSGASTFSIASTSSGYCVPVNSTTSGVQTNATFTNINGQSSTQYSSFAMSVPASTESNYLYTLNVSIPSSFASVQLLFNGISYEGLAGSMVVGPSFALATKNTVAATTVGSMKTWAARFLVGGTSVQFSLYASGLPANAGVPVTATFVPETSSQFVVGGTTLDDSNTLLGSSATQTVGAPDSLPYFAVNKFTASGSNNYDITVSCTPATLANIQIVSSDFQKVIAHTKYTSGAPKVSINLQSSAVPKGNYNIVAFPYGSGSRTCTFAVKKTIATSGASTMYVSMFALLVAFAVML